MAQSILEESKEAKRGIFGFIFKKKVLIIIGIVLVAAGATYYFLNRNNQSAAVAVQPKNWTVKKEDIKISVQSSGKVVAKDAVQLSFPVTGNLEVSDVYVKEGDKVKKGDKIASVKTESLEFELRSAYASYQSALANLNTKLAGATKNDIDKAQTAIDQAQVSLDQAKNSLESTKLTTAQSIANAANTLTTADKNFKLNSSVDDSESVRTAYNSLAAAIKSIDVSAQRWLRNSDSILGVDDTTINDDFEAVLGVKNISSLSAAKSSYYQLKSVIAEMDPAILNLTDAANGTIDMAADQARQILLTAQNHFYNLQTLLEATITFVNLTQTELDAFKTTISSDRSSANTLLASLDSSIQSVKDAKSNLDSYRVAYEKAVSDLETAKNQATQSVSNAEISIHSKEIALDQAKNDYAELIAPASEFDLASARSQLTSAAISVDKAKYNVDQATLTSPIDGVISMLNYKKGDIILSDSAKTMATIINNDTLFIEANIEEADVSKLKVGDKAEVTFDAVDGLDLTGEISFISLTSQTSSNGIVTYLVRIILSNTGATPIREGMTASIDFVTAEALGVLTAPVAAVHNIGGKPSVELADGTIVNVTTGFTDGKKVEIMSGLKEGDMIVY